MAENEIAEDMSKHCCAKAGDVKYAYIVFRSMDAIKLVKKAYNVGICKRKCTMSCFGSIMCKNE